VKVVFLGLDEVLALHADQIERYGGRPGIRDIALLLCALAAPASLFGSEFLHGSLHEKAAAYLFHLVRSHPFADGNRRVGLIAVLAFLGLNALRLQADPDELTRLVVGVAEGRTSKAEVAVFIRDHARPRRRAAPGAAARRPTRPEAAGR